jgi:hypothetical protein
MTVTSETAICNLALTRLGHRLITDMTENTKAAELCRLHYPLCRDAVLRAHPWNFAIKRIALMSEVATIAFDFTYRFPLPPDCLKVMRTDLDDACEVYRVEGRAIVTNATAVAIQYIARITDVTLYDAMFVDVLAARLAAEIAMPLTDTASLASSMMSVAEAKLRDARAMDAQEGTPRDMIDATGWLNARY